MKGKQMSDMAFEQMLAQYNADYQAAEEFSDWMPDDGEYIVTVVKSTKGTSDKDGKPFGWWKLVGRIEEPSNEKLNGEEFTLGFYNTNAFGILKGQAKALNGGTSVATFQEASTLFENATGLVLKVKVSTSTSKKNGKEYTNCYIKERIKVTDAVEPTEDAPDQDPVQ